MNIIEFLKEKFYKLFNKKLALPSPKEEGINLQKEIVDKIDPSWSEKEKARFVQVNLCKYISFDPELNLYDIIDKNYQNIYNKDFDIENLTETTVTCKSYGKIFIELLKRADPNIKTNLNTDFHHAIVTANLDGEEFRIDPTITTKEDNTQDIFKINKKIMPNSEKDFYSYLSFIPIKLLGEKPLDVPRTFTKQDTQIKEYLKELESIDKNINYIKKDTDYTNIYIAMLKSELDKVNIDTIKSKDEIITSLRESLGLTEDATREDIFRAKFKFILKTINIDNLGFYESSQYLKYMFNQLLDEKDLNYKEYSKELETNLTKSRIKGCDIYTTTDKGFDFKNVFWLQIGPDEYEYYILDHTNKETPIKAVSKEQLHKILEPNGKYKLSSENKTIPHIKEHKKEKTFNDLNRET